MIYQNLILNDKKHYLTQTINVATVKSSSLNEISEGCLHYNIISFHRFSGGRCHTPSKNTVWILGDSTSHYLLILDRHGQVSFIRKEHITTTNLRPLTMEDVPCTNSSTDDLLVYPCGLHIREYKTRSIKCYFNKESIANMFEAPVII